MHVVIPGANTKTITEKYTFNKSTKELKYYTKFFVESKAGSKKE